MNKKTSLPHFRALNERDYNRMAEYMNLKSYIFLLEKEHEKNKNNPLVLTLITEALGNADAKLRGLLLADTG